MDRAQIPATELTYTLPAVVFGIDTPIGLTIVRDLGRHGVPVYGVARNNEGLGLSSRWLRRGLVREAGTARAWTTSGSCSPTRRAWTAC